MKNKFFVAFLAVLLLTGRSIYAQVQVDIAADKSLAAVQPTMYGVFFEDINLGADGGIYAELIKNRSFEFFRPMMGWKVLGKMQTEGDFLVINKKDGSANPRFLRVQLHNNKAAELGLQNEGFRSMGIESGIRYDFSLMYRREGAPVSIKVELRDSNETVIGQQKLTLEGTANSWKHAEASFTATATTKKGHFVIWFEGDGPIDLDMISLFPSNTWKERKGGMRADMIQMLADMKPGFLRFPGGCIVEGFDLSQRYQWKNTIGPIEDRQLIINRWNYEFAHRPTPDYFQTFGLGFFEYFQLAEDIGAAPLPILNCGMACQFNSAEVVPMDQLDPYVQDALDLIEFANGDITTTWGKKRADMGHPESFHLTMMGIGNENWGPQYVERLKIFEKAIKAKYPDFKIVASSGTDPNGDRFDYLNGELRKLGADLIDEHYYRRPEWFFQNAGRYDSYPRTGSKIFAGEYAAQSDHTVSVENRNNWLTALSEAAFLTGLERNAGVVSMASYAPLFAHVDGWQWRPDLIWVDNLDIYGTPDYYVQQLFSLHKGTDVVSALSGGKPLEGKDSLYLSAVLNKNANQLVVKIVNAQDKPVDFRMRITGMKLKGDAERIELQSEELTAENSIDLPKHISPKKSQLVLKGKQPVITVPARSFTVLLLPVK